MLDELPDDIRRHFLFHLDAPDILNVLSINRDYSFRFGKQVFLWRLLLSREQGNISDAGRLMTSSLLGSSSSSSSSSVTSSSSLFIAVKQFFLHASRINSLQLVKWVDNVSQDRRTTPFRREGHAMCCLGTTTSGAHRNHRIVLTGGFCDDFGVHVLDLPKAFTNDNDQSSSVYSNTQDNSNNSSNNHNHTWHRIVPSREHRATFVYGASLTALNDNKHAVRFGGFRAGGYNAECSDVFLLTVEEDEDDGDQIMMDVDDVDNNDDDDDNDHGNREQQQQQQQRQQRECKMVVQWTQIQCSGTPPRPRAYHTATLLNDRYLLIIGGMTSAGSILDEAILDVQTWAWLDLPVVQHEVPVRGTGGFGFISCCPSNRHGHSVIMDEKRDRALLFGGGSGSDLLRTGVDNAEVWELSFDKSSGWKTDLPASLPWRWNLVHPDRYSYDDDGIDDDDDGAEEDEDLLSKEEDSAEKEELWHSSLASGNVLSQSERLVLGRCHVGLRASHKSAIFFSGCGRPATNAVLAYDLSEDQWKRPRVAGNIPVGRFTAAAVMIEEDGWMIVHGGYSGVHGGALGDMLVLDLAPTGYRGRAFPALQKLPDEDEMMERSETREIGIADYIADGHEEGNELITSLIAAPSDEHRRALATQLLVQELSRLRQGELGGFGQQLIFLLAALAEGRAILRDQADQVDMLSDGASAGGDGEEDNENIHAESINDDESL